MNKHHSFTSTQAPSQIYVTQQDILQFLKRKQLSVTPNWTKSVKYYLFKIHKLTGEYWSEPALIRTLYVLKKTYHSTTMKKILYQLKAFLRFKGVNWLQDIKLEKATRKLPVIVRKEHITELLSKIDSELDTYEFKQMIRTFVILGASTGMRPSELYNLTLDEINLDKRYIKLEHTKTATERYVIFSQQAKQELLAWLNQRRLFKGNRIFSEKICRREITKLGKQILNGEDFKPKYLRKFFSQEWDRKGGPTSIKKILMGHSLSNDVDLMHYAGHDWKSLREVYDRVF